MNRKCLTVSAILAMVLLSVAAGGCSPERKQEQATLTMVSTVKDPGPFDQAVKTAQLIVFGTVKSLGSPIISEAPPANPGQVAFGRAVTVPVILEVAQVLKGNAKAGEIVTFRQLGGQVGQSTMSFPGEAKFQVGENVLLFLYEPTGIYKTWTGGALYADQGKYVVDSLGVASNDFRSETFPLEALKTQISKALETK